MRNSIADGSRRRFLAGVGGAVLAAAAPPVLAAPGPSWQPVSAARLPRWRGFNLVENAGWRAKSPSMNGISTSWPRFGFDFVRLPLDSHRADVRYEEYKGHALNRKMLDLLRR